MLPTFTPMLLHLKNRFLNQEGQDLVEYALIAGMLSLCAVVAEKNLATGIFASYQILVARFSAAVL
jgi:Flp pilus assembly pilin Flp